MIHIAFNIHCVRKKNNGLAVLVANTVAFFSDTVYVKCYVNHHIFTSIALVFESMLINRDSNVCQST